MAGLRQPDGLSELTRLPPHQQEQLQTGGVQLVEAGQLQGDLVPIGERVQQNDLVLGRDLDGELALQPDRIEHLGAHGITSLATAASICGGWKGFTTQAFAPALWPAFFISSPDSVVSMITGVNLYAGSFFASWTKVIPSMFGMLTSEMIRWIFWPSSLVRASLPSTPSITV